MSRSTARDVPRPKPIDEPRRNEAAHAAPNHRRDPAVKSVTFWLVVALAISIALQVVPVVGLILMLTGAAGWMGWLLQLALLAMFVEALLRRIPRFLVVVPILA